MFRLDLDLDAQVRRVGNGAIALTRDHWAPLAILMPFNDAGRMKLSPGLIEEATSMVQRPLRDLSALGDELHQARDDEAKQRILQDARKAAKSLMVMAEEASAMIGSATI